MQLCGKVASKWGVLVVEDLPHSVPVVPGELGMNIIKECYGQLFVHHGTDLFNIPSMLQAPTPIQQALEQCHQFEATAPTDHLGRAKVKGGKVCRVPGGTMKIVAATYSPHHPADALFEPLSNGLPAGLLASPATVNVNRGTAYFPIVNIRIQDVVLYPHTILGTLSQASLISLPPGLEKGNSCSVFTDCNWFNAR